MSAKKPNPYEGTPENYLNFHNDGDGPDQSAINCALIRAEALVNLMHSQFSSGRNIERVSDEVLGAALWGITGHLNQIKILLKSAN